MTARVMIGYDESERDAYDVARYSIERRSRSGPVHVSPIVLADLRRIRMYWRPTERRDGRLFDIISGAPMSSEFALSRFFIPHLVDGDDVDWVLFADSDVVCLADINVLFRLANPRYALMCVQHDFYHPFSMTKKRGAFQTVYSRKNWSSVMLWNVRHPAHRQLTYDALNTLPGRDLHQMCWLETSQIGALPAHWNWLVREQARPLVDGIAHFTLGGPWLDGWKESAYDDIWTREHRCYREDCAEPSERADEGARS